jgi:hypothetical protein
MNVPPTIVSGYPQIAREASKPAMIADSTPAVLSPDRAQSPLR